MYDHNAVKIYVDGSSEPNPGKGGIGMVVEFPDDLDIPNLELGDGYVLSNNNRMEIRAVIRALEWLQANIKTYRFTRAIIITDSDYVYKSHSNAQYWKDNGWRSEEGKPYENPDLWDTFLKERVKTKVKHEIFWRKGKQNEILKRVDHMAKAGRKLGTKIDFGFQPGKFTAPRSENKKAATPFSASGQTVPIRVYRKKIYGKNDSLVYKITFDLYDRGAKKYTNKYFAYKEGDCGDMKRNNCYEVSFNKSSSYPLILGVAPIEYIKNGT